MFYRKISGEIEEDVVTEAEVAEVLGKEENGDVDAGGNDAPKKSKGAKRKKNVIYGQGAIFPELFSNSATEKRTIRIDTKLLAEAESDEGTESGKT